MGTEAYCCSPGAAATCSIRLSAGGVVDRVWALNPSWGVLGVAAWTLIGGG